MREHVCVPFGGSDYCAECGRDMCLTPRDTVSKSQLKRPAVQGFFERYDKAFAGATHDDKEWDVVISAPDYLALKEALASDPNHEDQ